MNKYLWTNLRARLQHISSSNGANYNWLFLPGGPGLGSESLSDLTRLLKLPGSIWQLDLPGDGSNTTSNDAKYFAQWSAALLEAASALPNPILVAHSTGGMYALATPGLEKILRGLVLMDSAPDSSWQQTFMQYAQANPLEMVEKLQARYTKKPSNALLQQITIAAAAYSFTKKGLGKGVSLLDKLPFNYKTCEWSAENFDQTYKAQWVPKNIPTLLFAGDKDKIVPLDFFRKSRKFQRKNIIIRAIENAGHFPWIENPRQVITVFQEYCQFLELSCIR